MDAALSSSALTGDARLLVEWWRLDPSGRRRWRRSREGIVAAAKAQPPAPWANHLLGREADREGRDAEAAESFAREASSLADRRDDATAALPHLDGGGRLRPASRLRSRIPRSRVRCRRSHYEWRMPHTSATGVR